MEPVLASVLAEAVAWDDLCFGFRLKLAAILATVGILMSMLSGNYRQLVQFAVRLLGVSLAVGISRAAVTLLGEVPL